MAHPKRKSRKQEEIKRRTHYKATVAQIATCPITEKHIYTTELTGMRENVLQRASCYR
jgi:ribosomal protein L32